jgi:hypothetical protein
MESATAHSAPSSTVRELVGWLGGATSVANFWGKIMVLNDMLLSLLRRWYIVVLGLILTAAGVYGAYSVTPVNFSASSTVVLLPPEKSVEDGDNPYLYLGGLGQALNVLVISMNSEASQELLIGSEPGQSFTLAQDNASTGPIINIAVEAPTGGQAVELVNKVTEQLPKTLDSLQDELKVPSDAKIGTMTLAESQEAKTENRRQLQVMIVVAGAGLVLTVLFVAALEKYLTKRKAKKGATKPNNKQDDHGPSGSGLSQIETSQRIDDKEIRRAIQPVRFAGGI